MLHLAPEPELARRLRELGDLRVGAITHLAGDDESVLLGGLGLSLPTGSTNERMPVFEGSGASPLGGVSGVVASARRLPYAMQLGSGTYDVMPQVTLRTEGDAWTGGAQAALRVPLGNNERGYRLGRRAELTTWVARELGASTSGSLRLGYTRRANIHGADDELIRTSTPANDPNRQGGERLDLLLGLAWHGASADGAPSGQRLSLEVGAPVWQDLSGPQLELDRVLMIGWQTTF